MAITTDAGFGVASLFFVREYVVKDVRQKILPLVSVDKKRLGVSVGTMPYK